MTIRARRRRWIAAALTAALAITGCSRGDDDADQPPASTTVPESTTVPVVDDPVVTVDGVPATDADAAPQLGIQLGEGSAAEVEAPPMPPAESTPLEPDEIATILGALPAWTIPETDEVEFDRPAETLLPPTVDTTIEQPFPPDDDGTPVEEPIAEPLEVLRYQPEGEVEIAPFVAVTFNQPMVPLATLDQLDAAEVPLEITPAIEGRWRWIGTRTLRFEVIPGEIDRLPAATRYDVTVPAGTASASGSRLAEEVSWTFTTPTPTVRDLAGVGDSMSTTPIWVATFDQRVDPDAVLSAITVTAAGEQVPLRRPTADEIDEDDVARNAMGAALDARAVAFTPEVELPVDADVEITIGPDIPSAEGPLTSPDVATYSGRTFGSLRISNTSCGYDDRCVPGSSFLIEFSNQLDPADFDAAMVEVEPAIPGLHIDVYGSVIELRGVTMGRTSYDVSLDGDLTDVFGQQLGEDATATFDVGPADPALRGLSSEFITTDPAAETPSVSVLTINHDAIRVRAWAVTPPMIGEYRDYVDEMWRDASAEPPDWSVAIDTEVAIDAPADTWTETDIDLTDAFNASNGQLVVRVDPVMEIDDSDEAYWENRPTIAWIQDTTLGIDAVLDADTLVIATSDLATGEPIGGVPVELIGDDRVATTDEDGLAEIELGDDVVIGLYGDTGDRSAFLPTDEWEGWRAQTETPEARWYVFDDRGIYRPGETAHITGWARRFAWTDGARLELYEDGTTVSWRAFDAQGAELGSGTGELSPLGRFTIDLALPEGTNLGQAYVEIQLDQFTDYGITSHTIEVQEFRRPEFEVTARAETPAPYFAAQPATVAVDAEYFAGGPLPDAEVSWLVGTTETNYTPPGRDDYTFGVFQPWWWYGDDIGSSEAAEDIACSDCGPGFGTTTYEEFSGRTDASGTHYLEVAFDGDDVDLPSTVSAEATVFDVNRQAWASRTDLLVHPARQYVGLRSDRNFVRAGTPIRVDAIVTDIDGELVEGRPVDVTAGRLEWGLVDGEWTEQLVDEQTCAFTSTTTVDGDEMRCAFDTGSSGSVGGSYRITAIVTDEAGGTNRTELTQWVAGGSGRPSRNVEQEQVTIVPDRDEYAPGDTAELLVQAPFAPAYGIVTTSHHGIETSKAFDAEDGSAVIEIPITDEHFPNLTVLVDMNGSAPRTDDDGNPVDGVPPRPAFATGAIDLPVPPTARTLDVAVEPAADAVEPGDDTSVTVRVTDADGEPAAGADVAVVVVDEAVLALTGYELVDPTDLFYQNVWSAIRTQYLRSTIVLSTAEQLTGDEDTAGTTVPGVGEAAPDESAEESADDAGSGDGADTDAGGRAGESSAQIELRTDFDPVAVYVPDAVTGEDGSVTVDVPLPDSLTRYRVLAVAVDGVDRFGKGESTITARLPLMVRASAPRFLNFGDRFELPVVLQNQTDEPLEVDVAIEVANLALSGPAGLRVTVPAGDRVEVRFPTTTVSAGTARARVAAVSGSFTDAAEFSLPVYTPSTSEAFAVYGTIDEGAVGQPLVAPEGVIPQYGGLEIDISSTAVQALTDAVLYLEEYEYESSDGYASRIMAVAALRDVLDAFDAAGLPPTAELEARVASDISRLIALQNDDGGFPYWQRGRESIPWNSVQATHALVLARDADYPVSASALDRALAFIADIEAHIPADYPAEIRNTIRAYALYVLNEGGAPDPAGAEDLFLEVGDDLALDALAWIWPSIDDPDLRTLIERRFANSVVETPGGATFATGYGEDAYLIAHSERRADGVILDALITEQPDSDLIPKVVSGLLSQRVNGHWNNAQENSFILLAMHRYFETFEATDPAFVARAWLGQTYVAETELVGRTTEQAATLVPMSELLGLAAPPADPTADPLLVLAKDGEGRLYYRLGLRYAPADLQLDARDEGFVVERSYEPVGEDDGEDDTVRRNDDGSWQIDAGATVRVRVTMVADARRTNVALIDPLPAGLEPLNPSLAVSSTIPPDDEPDDEPVEIQPRFWWWNWFEHQNLRDDRAEAFTTYLDGGTYEYSYVARATTPGVFVVPPARAEEIFSPEVFGRSATDTVIVD
jgi:alpha-2-macroglobulin